MENQTERSLELARIEERITHKKKELDFINQQVIDGEKAFSERSTELKKIISDLEKTVRQLREQAREYDQGMQFTRQEDKDRKVELAKHEVDLIARERRLAQDQQDFEHRKKRFQQLKELSQ